MAKQRRSNTGIEVELRRALHREGLRFRIEWPVPGKPRRRVDIAFTRAKVAVMVDGCFWHVCPDHGTWPANNAEWWRTKLLGNVARDRDTDATLEGAGWQVVRIWEHEDLDVATARVIDAVRQRVVAGHVPTRN
jgi:DNA mismatch endonuclease (patch repair protein)